jgi:hypothetical protein
MIYPIVGGRSMVETPTGDTWVQHEKKIAAIDLMGRLWHSFLSDGNHEEPFSQVVYEYSNRIDARCDIILQPTPTQ